MAKKKVATDFTDLWDFFSDSIVTMQQSSSDLKKKQFVKIRAIRGKKTCCELHASGLFIF